jgi:SAM-dependent methyltransferase
MTQAIQPHNVEAAATWNAGGQHYDKISHTISDSIEHCVIRLAPRPGERILDVATGTGWTARRVAVHGAAVTGIDLGADLIEAAKSAAAEARLDIDYRAMPEARLRGPGFDASFQPAGSCSCGTRRRPLPSWHGFAGRVADLVSRPGLPTEPSQASSRS